MRFKANYNFTVWSFTFAKGGEYDVQDEVTVRKMKGLEPNPFGGAMFTEVEEEKEKKVSKQPMTSDESDAVKLTDPEVEELQKKYVAKFGKEPPVTYKNNKEWLEKKLAE